MAYRAIGLSEKLFERRNSIVVWIGNRPVLVAKLKNELFGMDAVCAHRGCALLTEVEGSVAVCPAHEARYDMRNGNMVAKPKFAEDAPCGAEELKSPLRTYPSRINDGHIELEIS